MRSLIVLAVVALASVTSLAACGGAAPATPTTPSGDAHPAVPGGGALKENGEAKVGDKTKCPVSGEEFTVSATSPKVEYNGKTYYTCCAGCQKKLEADPAKFLAKPKT